MRAYSWLFALVNWLYANVFGNLIASVLWAVPGFAWQHRRLTYHTAKQIQALQRRLDLHFGATTEGPHAQVREEADRSRSEAMVR